MIPLNYHHLYYFYVIARSGSIAKACDALLLAQPTLSAQLRQLEKSLGVKLFERFKQRLHLTEAGRFVLDYAESIFEMGEELQDSLRDQSHQGKVALQLGVVSGTPRAFGHALLSEALKDPQLAQIDLEEGPEEKLLRELRAHRLDAILSDRGAGVLTKEYENHLIAKVPIYFAASPHLARRYPRLPQNLDQAPFILPSAPGAVSEQILERLAAWNVNPRLVAKVQDVELARRLAIDGHGIVPLNAYTIQVSQPVKHLHVLRCQPALNVFESVYLITRPRRWANPIVQVLLKNFRLPL